MVIQPKRQTLLLHRFSLFASLSASLFNPTTAASGVDTKSYQGLDRHFWSVNDQSDHFLIESDHKSKPLSGRPRK